MNEEEAIEEMQHWIDYEKENKDKINRADKLIEIQETVLNSLEKKDKEIQFQKEINKTEQNRHKQTEKSLKGQLKKKDKIIDLMAEEFENLKLAYFKKEDGGEFMGKYRTYNKNDWKQYFERKVENGN